MYFSTIRKMLRTTVFYLVTTTLTVSLCHDEDNERVFFYNANVEVDFYVPEDELAIQVSYSLADPETLERESGALAKLPNAQPCRRRVIITYDEEGSLNDKHASIEIIPCWKWLIGEW